ncbi:MAG: RES domain-containing protein [Nitriliruptorales bacterium]
MLRHLRTTTWPAGLPLRRGHKRRHPDPTALVPAKGDTRFAPLDEIDHVYLARTTFAALLESAFHDAAPPAPRLPEAVIALWSEAEVVLRADVRLIDLRDPALTELGLDRSQLTATTAAHYPCTQVWAQRLRGRHVGGHPTHGLVWHSRQLELHAGAAAKRPALTELLDEHPAEVAVVWSPPATSDLLASGAGGLGRLDTGTGRTYVDDGIALLQIVSQ